MVATIASFLLPGDAAASATWAAREVTQLADAFNWCGQGFDRLMNSGVCSTQLLMSLLTDRVITTSTAFSGVGTPDTADVLIEHSAARFVSQNAGNEYANILQRAAPLKFTPLFAVESDAACREELLAMPQPPACLFPDVMAFMTQDVHTMWRAGKTNEQLAKVVQYILR